MNEEMMTMNEETTQVAVQEESNESGNGGFIGLICGAVALAAVGGGIFAWKKGKAKRDKKKFNKYVEYLESKGCAVYVPGEDEEFEEDVTVETEVVDTEDDMK